MSSTELTPYRAASLDEKRAYVQTLTAAGDLIKKGLWSNTKNPDTGQMENRPSPGKILLVIETGLMLGLHPMAALQGIDVIEGNPTLKPALMSALIRGAGHVLRIEQTGTVEGGDLAVTTTGVRTDDPEHPYIYTWTPHDALRAGLLDSYEPDEKGVWRVRARSSTGKSKPWENYTARMCRWRSLGDVASAGFEDVLMGLHYTPEEFGADVDAEGAFLALPVSEPSEGWSAAIEACGSKEELLAVKERAGGEWNDRLNTELLTRVGALSRAKEIADSQPEPLVVVAKPVKRQWLSEAKAAESVDALRAVWLEASAAGATAELLEEINALEASLPDVPKVGASGEGWAAPDVAEPSWDDVVESEGEES